MSNTRRATHARTDRAALRRRVASMIRSMNSGRWDRCYETIDPRLRAKQTPDPRHYAEQLRVFQERYGKITPWHTRISMHLDTTANKRDPRPFAYVYIVWKDAESEFHMFRERWVKEGGKWYTRVTGLLPSNAAQ